MNRGIFTRGAASWAFLALVLLAAARNADAAAFPSRLHFRTVSTARVTLHFHQGLEPMAREAASLATEILEAHEARYGVHVGRVHIVLADVDDDPNGFASPLPYPLVHIRAAAPDGSDEFGNLDGWLRLVLTHELAHIVHLDQARGLLRLGRKVLGRSPYLFPNALTPGWMIEGLATYEETQGTAFGRGRNPDSRMVLRMASLDGVFPSEDRPVRGIDAWPGGQAAYLFGEAFLRDLSDRFGDSTLPELARAHSGRAIPYVDELTSHRVTGAGFHTRWREWKTSVGFSLGDEVERLKAQGLTPSRPLTTRGVRQSGPRYSPDGSWIAYTNRSLTHFRAIHLVRPDGTGDHKLVDRNGGGTLAWSPDGRTIVFDEPEVYDAFATRKDLRAVDVATGRVRRLTRGARSEYPDVSPEGGVVFVRQLGDRSELATLGLAQGPSQPKELTRSRPETQWSSPRWSPRGDRIAASRWLPGGWLDLVLVDPHTGEVENLTEDRAKDIEPTWTPDGSHVVFRSDRDGVSNLYACRLSDRALLRVTRVLGGAFTPAVSPDGREVVFSDYGSRGSDLRVAALDLDAAEPAPLFSDPYPEPRPNPAPVTSPAKDDFPLPTLLPRFWTPYLATPSHEFQYGVVTSGVDPLLRHFYALDVHRGTGTDRTSERFFYLYDRFRPSFQVSGENSHERNLIGAEPEERQEQSVRTQQIAFGISIPLVRSFHGSQAASLTWRRKREMVETGPAANPLDLGGLQAAWSLSSVKQYPFSISPVDGYRLRVAFLREDPRLGSELSLGKLTLDGRGYFRLPREGHVLALRTGFGATFGRPSFKRSFTVGGFPDGSLFDVVSTNLAVLRGYRDDAFSGRRFAQVNLEYRVPLWHPQRGLRSLPAFLRHLHGTVFADAAHAWSDAFRLEDVKTAAGVAIGADLFALQGLPVTATSGVARGFSRGGDTRVYLRVGLAF